MRPMRNIRGRTNGDGTRGGESRASISATQSGPAPAAEGADSLNRQFINNRIMRNGLPLDEPMGFCLFNEFTALVTNSQHAILRPAFGYSLPSDGRAPG